MSADRAIGIAILEANHADPSHEFLTVLCKPANAEAAYCRIPIRPKGARKVLEHQWEYEIEPPHTLKVTPSLNWVGFFHNDGEWRIDFQFFEPGQWVHPGDQFRAVNQLQK